MSEVDNTIYRCPHCNEKMEWMDDETDEYNDITTTSSIYVCFACGHQEEIIH